MDKLEQLELEEKQKKQFNLMKKLFRIVANRKFNGKTSKYDDLLFLIQEMVWFQWAKKEIPEQVDEFYEHVNVEKIKIEVKEDEALYEQMMLPGLEKFIRQPLKKKTKVSPQMFAKNGCFIKYQSEMSPTEVLILHDKKILTGLCKYMGISVPQSANKKNLANSLWLAICEKPIQLLPALSSSAVKLLIEFAKMKEQESVDINENTIDDYMLLVYWGILSIEIIKREGKLYFAISMPKEVEQRVLPKVLKFEKEGMKGEKNAEYLDCMHLYIVEQLYQRYDELILQIKKILILYGVLEEEELYQMFISLTDTKCDKEDFVRFVYLKGSFQGILATGKNRFTKQRLIGLNGKIIDKYLEQEKSPVEQHCKYECLEELLIGLEEAEERWIEVEYVMEQWDLLAEELEALLAEEYLNVSCGESLNNVLGRLVYEYNIEDTVDIACLWRALVLICLQQPCYLLKGYSRLRAERELGFKRYYGMFEVKQTKKATVKLMIHELPEKVQQQIADMVLLSQNGMLDEVIEAEQKLEGKYRTNKTVNAVLTMNMVDAYVHLSSKEQQSQWKRKVEQRVQCWCDDIRNSEERNLMLCWCEKVGFELYYKENNLVKAKSNKPIEEVIESYFWEDRGPEILPIVKDAKIYPNDPCPCGSGKKYKKCCGKTK